ncbi:MAG: HAD hydrolase family protein [Spirochaetales bacterium]|nr:HAD hydrolase family protein [Spirochaetales bacterium]
MNLNFFFDIDGTLLPIGMPIPQSALDALWKAKNLGCRLFLSSGRSPHELSDEIKVFPFDGGVFSAGATVIFRGKTVVKKYFSDEQRAFFLDVADRYRLSWLLQGPDGTYTTRDGLAFHEEMTVAKYGRKTSFPDFRMVERFPDDVPLIKAYIMSREGLVLKAREELEGPFHCTDNTTGMAPTIAGEVMAKGASKSSGIKALLDYLGDGVETSVGVGDGENDLDMIDFCHTGIAMGNACDILKQHADYICADINNDGLADAIEYALNRAGLR